MPTAAIPRRRRSSFDKPGTPRPFRLQARDIAILRAVARFGTLDNKQIAKHLRLTQPTQLVGGHSENQLRRRCRALADVGFLELPDAQKFLAAYTFKDGGGSIPLTYALSTAGAKEVARFDSYVDPRTAWARKARDVSPFTLTHQLEVATFMLATREACNNAGLSLADHYDLIASFPSQPDAPHLKSIFQLTVKLPDTYLSIIDPKDVRPTADKLTVHTKPDRVFSIASFADRTRTNYAFERDRATEDIDPTFLSPKATIRKKVLGYFHAFKQHLHTTQWGFQNFRALFETTSEHHVDAMIDLIQREIPNGSALFLFSTTARIQEHGVLGPAWTQFANGERTTVRLLRTPQSSSPS